MLRDQLFEILAYLIYQDNPLQKIP